MGNKESALRVPPRPSAFGPWFYQVDQEGLGDKAFVGIAAFFASFAFIMFIMLFGVVGEYLNLREGKKRKEFLKTAALKYGSVFFMIFLGWAILGSSFAYTWRQGFLEGALPYRIGLAEHVECRLGLHVGLRGINVTLEGLPIRQHGELIKWNEQYLWSDGQGQIDGWLHGRFGFGPYSNLLAQQFRAGQFRGTPLPILETLEWLTLDGESIRWHRWYHNGGYFAHVSLWMAFVFWVVTAITTVIRPATGMIWLGACGFCMWFAAALYHGLTEKANPALAIPFDGHVLRPTFGWAYHLTLVVGILVNILAIFLWYCFEKFGYTTDAFSLSIASFEKPSEVIQADKPLEEVVVGGGRSFSHQSTFRRGRSTFGKPVRSFKESTSKGISTRGRSSRRTKKYFGKAVDKPVRGNGNTSVPTLASLGSALDDIDEVEIVKPTEGTSTTEV